MKNARYALAVAFSALVTGCAAQPEKELASLSPASDVHEGTQRILQFAAGYCKGMADKHGADFATCFKQQTDLAIAQIEAQAANQAEQSN
ncbi:MULTISPECIES: hypothetical protein [Ectopseudomonas]|jgi:hypothetical protein|uniref:Uncharacterized protein n=2 Tax=Ectopseudomonas TaxID=3236654 RepID=A0A1G6PV69_9GAMM|nr:MULTISPECIES: hypothetical protein [Pseudomonas]ALN21892.1 hypothetical protein DW68_024755 [Pseudomonas mendocina S5.2]KER98054.1 hypothetical protein HN51_24945 [Pseudomonas mendocina]MBP3061938.1 hypothetical protein [Pseudomonas chengduensis]NNB75230.1 hypothetical protein [Pseudomonas chengduensis]SDC83938.1 hypothetical protein SAMN05216576_107106 [Pseudomonas chengduensis]